MAQVSRTQFVTRPRDSERTKRKKAAWFDRVKILLVLAILFGFSVWAEVGDNPILPVSEAVRSVVRNRWWLLVLMGLELLRQIHYVIAEHWSRYYLFWKRIFGRTNRRIDRINPWTRFRLARVWNCILILIVFNAFVAWRNDVTFLTQLVNLPSDIVDYLFGTATEMPLLFSIIFGVGFNIFIFVAIFWFMGKGGIETYYPDDVQTRFADVWGQDAVLEKMKENLVFVEDPEAIEEKGGHVPAGVLLYGPPGTGKTLMAEAVAGETGKPYVFVEPGAFLNMFFGVGVLKVRSLFKKLRKLALRYGGVIVFFDEADALGNRGVPSGGAGATHAHKCGGFGYLTETTRSSLLWEDQITTPAAERRGGWRLMMPGMRGGGGDVSALQALLAQMSGLTKPRGFFNRYVRRTLGMQPKPPPKYRIFFVMASNMPESLDAALLRPGRLDRKYKVGYPSKEGRKRTFEGYLSKVSHVLTDEDVEKLATISPYATGASIKSMVNEALIHAIGEGRDTIEWPDVLAAKHLEQHGLADDFEYITRERHAVAIHEACHAIAFVRLSKGVTIDVATIERRGDVGGFVAPIPIEDQMFTWKSERENDIMISLASLAGERMFFDGDSSVGVGGDLRSATLVAMQMEGMSGMGETVASHMVTKLSTNRMQNESVETGTDRMWLDSAFGERVEQRLEHLLMEVNALLERDRIWVLALAHALELYKTVPGEDVMAILEGRQGPTIDGTAYHDPHFQERIEEYHRAALVAHQAVAPVAIPLPQAQPALVAAGQVYDTGGNGWGARPPAPAGNGWPVAEASPLPVAPPVGGPPPQQPLGNGWGRPVDMPRPPAGTESDPPPPAPRVAPPPDEFGWARPPGNGHAPSDDPAPEAGHTPPEPENGAGAPE